MASTTRSRASCSLNLATLSPTTEDRYFWIDFQSKTFCVPEARTSKYENGPMTAGTLPKGPPLLRPSACRLDFCTTSCTSPLILGSRSLSFCHFSPRASMVLYSDKRPARFWRRARSIASLKVSCRTPGVALASGTLPITAFWIDVETCIAPLPEPAADAGGELWAHRTAGERATDAIRKTIRKIADLFIVINQLVRYY